MSQDCGVAHGCRNSEQRLISSFTNTEDIENEQKFGPKCCNTLLTCVKVYILYTNSLKRLTHRMKPHSSSAPPILFQQFLPVLMLC